MNIIYVVVILILLILLLSWKLWKLLLNNEKLEDTLEQKIEKERKLDEIIDYCVIKIDEVDSKGSFKSDDEVGFFFDEIIKLKDLLRNGK